MDYHFFIIAAVLAVAITLIGYANWHMYRHPLTPEEEAEIKAEAQIW